MGMQKSSMFESLTEPSLSLQQVFWWISVGWIVNLTWSGWFSSGFSGFHPLRKFKIKIENKRNIYKQIRKLLIKIGSFKKKKKKKKKKLKKNGSLKKKKKKKKKKS